MKKNRFVMIVLATLGVAGMLMALSVLGLLGYAATRPDTFEVERHRLIQAPAEAIFPLINEVRGFNTWSPFTRRGTYEGPASGPGAAFEFDEDNRNNFARLQITAADPPRHVHMVFEMAEPFEGLLDVDFDLRPGAAAGSGTEVSWRMRGPSPFMDRLLGVFFDVDTLLGEDFEAGLGNLQREVEQPS